MKNKEKYAKEIIELAEKGERVAASGGKPVSCNLFERCEDGCDFNTDCTQSREKWFNKEYNPWRNVAVDTKILVSQDGVNWYKRHFAKCVDGVVYAFWDGNTSFTSDSNDYVKAWNYAKLYDEYKKDNFDTEKGRDTNENS